MSAPRELPPAGLCEHCLHARIVVSKRSRFLRCERANGDPRLARYPALPVLACVGYEPLGEEGGGGGGGGGLRPA